MLIIDGFFFVSFSSILTPVKIKINPQFPHNNIRKSFMLSLSSSLSISLISPVFLRLLAWWRIVALCGSSHGKFCSGEWSSSRSSYPRERHTMPRCTRVGLRSLFVFSAVTHPKKRGPNPAAWVIHFSLLLFLLSETYLPSSEPWGRGESKKKKSIVGWGSSRRRRKKKRGQRTTHHNRFIQEPNRVNQ